MNNSEVTIEKILKFEQEYKLKTRTVLGINIWECRRTRNLNEIIETTKNQQKMCDVEKIKKIKIFSIKNFITKKDYNKDILLITDARRVKNNGKYESIYTDEIERILDNKYSCLTLEEPSWTSYTQIPESHQYNCTTKNIKYVDLYEILAIIRCWFVKTFCYKKMRLVEKEVERIIKEVNNYFNIDFSYTKSNYIDNILYFYTMKKTYSRLIDKIKPKCVCFYYRDFPFKILILNILKEKNIPSIEMQHGFFTEDEPIEKKGDVHNHWDCIPEYLFAYGKLQTEVSNLAYEKDKIKYIGNLFLEKKVKENITSDISEDIPGKYILVISQSTMGNYISNIIANLADELLDTEYSIVYKYHPNEVSREYKCLDKSNIIQIRDNSEEIYKYQRNAIAQIGVSSTAIFEGLSFDLPTIILKNPENFIGVEKILRKFKRGIYFVEDEKQICKYLKAGLEKPIKEDICSLWQQNSTDNLKREIENIIGR